VAHRQDRISLPAVELRSISYHGFIAVRQNVVKGAGACAVRFVYVFCKPVAKGVSSHWAVSHPAGLCCAAAASGLSGIYEPHMEAPGEQNSCSDFEMFSGAGPSWIQDLGMGDADVLLAWAGVMLVI
jgi:hypothetical protein